MHAVSNDPLLIPDRSFYPDSMILWIKNAWSQTSPRFFYTKLSNLIQKLVCLLDTYIQQIYRCRSIKKSDLTIPDFSYFTWSDILIHFFEKSDRVCPHGSSQNLILGMSYLFGDMMGYVTHCVNTPWEETHQYGWHCSALTIFSSCGQQ